MKHKATARRAVVSAAIESLETRSLMSTVTVTSLADSGAGSLRAAVSSAASGDTIAFGSLHGTIALQSTLDISGKDLTITGSGRGNLTVDASAIAQAFLAVGDGMPRSYTISDLKIIGGQAGTAQGAAIGISGMTAADEAAHLSLTNVDITGGVGEGRGGGIYALNTYLTMDHCNVYQNTVSGYTANGGGLYFDTCTLTITASSFYNNTATSSDNYAYAQGGGLYVTGTNYAFLTNVTVANNTVEKTAPSNDSPMQGGGMYLNGSAQILSSTFAYNHVLPPSINSGDVAGGGLYLDNNSTTYVQNSIVALNSAPASADMFSTGSSILAGFDLIGDGTGSGATDGQYGSHVGTTESLLNVKIGQLASNGGDVKTIALLTSSPAIDTAYNNGPETDARGVSRGDTPDIGAYEYVPVTTPVFTARPRGYYNNTGTGVRLAANATAGTELTYTWCLRSKPAHTGHPVLADATAAGTATAFSKAGTYQFRVTATDANGVSIARTVTVTIDQVATGLHIVQHKRTLSGTEPTRMRAYVYDQFGQKLITQPRFTWALEEGDGEIDARTGLYTPPGDDEFSHLLFRATAGSLTGIAGNQIV